MSDELLEIVHEVLEFYGIGSTLHCSRMFAMTPFLHHGSSSSADTAFSIVILSSNYAIHVEMIKSLFLFLIVFHGSFLGSTLMMLRVIGAPSLFGDASFFDDVGFRSPVDAFATPEVFDVETSLPDDDFALSEECLILSDEVFPFSPCDLAMIMVQILGFYFSFSSES